MTFKNVDPVKQVTVLDVQWSNLSEEVVDDVRKLWENMELGNDVCYVRWDEQDFHDTDTEEDEQYRYPALAEYLRSRGIEKCLIHYWW